MPDGTPWSTNWSATARTFVLVAELAHAHLDTLRVYSQPTEAGKLNALRHLPVDR